MKYSTSLNTTRVVKADTESHEDVLPSDLLPEDHQRRSDFVRALVQLSCKNENAAPTSLFTRVPRTIVQFWHHLDELPEDVKNCTESWKALQKRGFDYLLFDHYGASDFIERKLGGRFVEAFNKCYHPAMQSDYFRLCYIFKEGGCYVDADDVFCGSEIEHLFTDGKLRIQPLCYDISTGQMVDPSIFTKPGAVARSWIFYFNNNPLIAAHGHPVVERALMQATKSLEGSGGSVLPEIQSTTGPGNLTKSVFDLAMERSEIDSALLVLWEWEKIAVVKWPLSYRSDARNWRLCNQQYFEVMKGRNESL